MAKKKNKKPNNPFEEYVARPYRITITKEGRKPNCTHHEILKNVCGGMIGTCKLCGRVKEYKAKVVGEVIKEHAVRRRRS